MSLDSDKPWILRPYLEDEDEDAIVSLWCQSYMRSREGIERGCYDPDILGAVQRSDPRIRRNVQAFWAELAPFVESILRTADVVVAVDREQPTTTAVGPAILLGFAAVDRDVVHYALVKRKLPDDARAVVIRDLLGARLTRPCRHTSELVELPNAGVPVPPTWTRDLALFRQMRGAVRPRALKATCDA